MNANPVTNRQATILTEDQERELVAEYHAISQAKQTTVEDLAAKWGFKSRRSVYLLVEKHSDLDPNKKPPVLNNQGAETTTEAVATQSKFSIPLAKPSASAPNGGDELD